MVKLTYEERLIFSMHFNGDETPNRSTRLFIGHNIDEHGVAYKETGETYIIYDYNGSRFEWDTLAEAMRVLLNNGGWGQFSIKDVTDR